MKISDAVDEYLGSNRRRLTAKTYRWYTYHLERFQGWCTDHKIHDLSELQIRSVQDALDAYEAPASSSKRGYVQVVKSFLAWCSDQDIEDLSRIVRRIDKPKNEITDVDLFSPEDIERLLKISKLFPYPLRTKAIIHILLDTGIRAAELCIDGSRPQEQTGLLLENVVLGRDDNYVRVMGKGRKERVVGFGKETASAIRRYIDKERLRIDVPYLLLSRKHTPLSVNQLNHLLKDLGDAAQVPNTYPHRFRHTFAVNQLLNGTSDLVLMQLMGHTSLEATKVYTRALNGIQAARAASSVVDKMRGKQKW